ncbi:hypothetical protein RB195_013343 [Necator americanus]|uniref:Uncharacterized protein n=1 Tax=Necator americanus TaxID=51031 RepID=A0ABR1DV53_NECAM
MELNLKVDLEAILSRRRLADKTWDLVEDAEAPFVKRSRSDEYVLREGSKIWCDAQVQPSYETVKMEVDSTGHTQMEEISGKPLLITDTQSQHLHLDASKQSNMPSSEAMLENTVQIFPQTVPLYVNQSQGNDFSYCHRSAFSRLRTHRINTREWYVLIDRSGFQCCNSEW